MVFKVEDKDLLVRTKLPSNSSGQAFSRFVVLARDKKKLKFLAINLMSVNMKLIIKSLFYLKFYYNSLNAILKVLQP